MQDEWAIQQVINTYSQAASQGDWDRAVDTYLPDGIWEIPHLFMRLEGHDAVRGALTDFFGAMDHVVQLNSPAIVTVTGDSATASSAIREAGKSKGRDEGFEFFGVYEDRLLRSGQGWKFVHRIFRWLGTNTFPLVPGTNR